MHTTTHNYVISLTTAKERREHIIQEFGKQDIPFIFFDAINPSLELNKHIERLCPILAKSGLSEGEKACFISHLLLWEMAVNENLYYINVFEDDVILGTDAGMLFKDSSLILDNLNLDSNLILNYETDCDSVFREPIENLTLIGRRITKLISVNYGTAGYLITKNCAKRLLSIIKELSYEEVAPIDILIFKEWLNNGEYEVLQIEPAICIQEDKLRKKESVLNSQLEHNRSKREEKQKLTFTGKIYRLLTKIHRMRQKYLDKQYKEKNKIPFK